MKQKRVTLKSVVLLLTLLALPLTVAAQSVKGSVTDAQSGEPLIGVTVKTLDGKGMAVTDFDGKYDVQAADDARLQFSYVGYENVVVTQDDDCVFPRSQDARSISHLFLHEARRLGIELQTGIRINQLSNLSDYDNVVIAIGGQPRRERLLWLEQPIEEPVPSLFTLSIADERLHELMGTVVPQAQALLPGTRLRASGPLLITHWGMSGPCILRLSSYGARMLHDCDYRHPLAINWLGLSVSEAQQMLAQIISSHPQRQLGSLRPDGMQQRLWQYLLEKSLASRAHAPWGSLNQKEQNRLLNTLTNDTYAISGRAPHRDEFVTCGGVCLTAVNPQTLESKTHPRLYFVGEVLDIDGVTGGFNFQAAWTTAYTVARAITANI